jgi:hypothetical protein
VLQTPPPLLSFLFLPITRRYTSANTVTCYCTIPITVLILHGNCAIKHSLYFWQHLVSAVPEQTRRLHNFFPHSLSLPCVAATHLRLRYTRGSFHIIPACASACPSSILPLSSFISGATTAIALHRVCMTTIPGHKAVQQLRVKKAAFRRAVNGSCQLEWLSHRFCIQHFD